MFIYAEVSIFLDCGLNDEVRKLGYLDMCTLILFLSVGQRK